MDPAVGLSESPAATRRRVNRAEPLMLATLRALANEDTTWKRHARCAGLSPALFYLDSGQTDAAAAAKAICAECPVTFECADYGARFGLDHGIWGGLSPKGLRRWRRARNRQIIKKPVHVLPCDCAAHRSRGVA